MTPAQRAIACTAIGQLSSLPKWEWLPGMKTDDGCRVLGVFGAWMVVAALGGGGTTDHFRLPTGEDERPNLADDLTLHGLVYLVRRAWKGHVLNVWWREDGTVSLEILRLLEPSIVYVPTFTADGQPDDVFVTALEKAP